MSPPSSTPQGLAAPSGEPGTQLPALATGAGPAAAASEREAADEAARQAVHRLFVLTAALAAVWVLAWAAAGAQAARALWPLAEFSPVYGGAGGLVIALAWLVVGHAGMARAWVRSDGSGLAAWSGADALSTGFERYGPIASGGALDPAEAGWVDIVRDSAQQVGLSRPKLFVWSAEPAINAAIAGWTPSTCALIVTRGALDKLSPREQRALATHQLLQVQSGQARFQLAATSLIWGFAWVRLSGEHRRQPEASSGEPASATRHLLGSLQTALGLLGLPFARWLQRRAAAGRHEAADTALAESCPDLRVPMSTVLQKVWYEADNHGDRLRSARSALLQPFLLSSSAGGLGRTHPSLEQRVLRLSGQPGLPLATGPLGSTLEAAASSMRQAASAPAPLADRAEPAPSIALAPIAVAAEPRAPSSRAPDAEPWFDGPIHDDEQPGDLSALFGQTSASDHPPIRSAGDEPARAPAAVPEPAPARREAPPDPVAVPAPDRPIVVAPARWAAALAAADARAPQNEPSAADASAAAAALGLPTAAAVRPAPGRMTPTGSRREDSVVRTAEARGVAPEPASTPANRSPAHGWRLRAAALHPTPPDAGTGTGTAGSPRTLGSNARTSSAAAGAAQNIQPVVEPLAGRFMALPPAPDADSPEGRELARLVGVALPADRLRPEVSAPSAAGGRTEDLGAAVSGSAAAAAAVGGRRPQRWKRATVDPTGKRTVRRAGGGGAAHRSEKGRGGPPSGFGTPSGWHSGFDPTSGFGPIADFDPSDNTPLPDLPPIPPLPGATPAEVAAPTTRDAGQPSRRADGPPARRVPETPQSAADFAELEGLLRPAERAVPPPQEDAQAPLVRAALGLPPPGRVTAVPRAGDKAATPAASPDTSKAVPPASAPDGGFAPTEWMTRPIARAAPGGGVAPPSQSTRWSTEPLQPRPAPAASATAGRPSGAAAAMAAAEEALAREAAGRLGHLSGREELRASILSFMIATDSGRELAAWRSETGAVPAHERILEDLAAQPCEALMPWFGELVRRASSGSLEERRAMVESARRVMTAAGVVRPLDRLRWLTLRHGLGASSRKPQVAPAAPPEDHTAFYRANLSHIATYTAFLARMIPVYAADVGIDPIGERWYQAVLQRFVGVGALPPCRVPDSDSLVHALRALQSLSWLNRPPLVRAWVGEAIGHAGASGLTADAADALFMTCLLLDSPMPGELARYFPTVATRAERR